MNRSVLLPPLLPTAGRLALVSALVLSVLLPSLTLAQTETPRVETLEQLSYSFRYQRAADALELVRPMLSKRGSVELQGGSNRLIVVDSTDRVSAITHLLREFDHPPRPLRITVQLLRASRYPGGPSGDPTIASRELTERLRRVLRYDYYRILAESELEALEGEVVEQTLPGGFHVRFDVGTVIQGKRLRLSEFQIEREAPEGRRTFNANLNLWLGNTLALALTRDETSESGLVVAVTSRAVE